jgi:hypothetical protein
MSTPIPTMRKHDCLPPTLKLNYTFRNFRASTGNCGFSLISVDSTRPNLKSRNFWNASSLFSQNIIGLDGTSFVDFSLWSFELFWRKTEMTSAVSFLTYSQLIILKFRTRNVLQNKTGRSFNEWRKYCFLSKPGFNAVRLFLLSYDLKRNLEGISLDLFRTDVLNC